MKTLLLLCGSLLLALSGSGCSLWRNEKDLDNSMVPLRSASANDPLTAVLAARKSNSVVLHLAGAQIENPSRVIPLPPDGSPVFVSDLLRQSGLTEEYPRMQATLHRNATDAISGIRLGIRFAHRSNQVLPEHDYQLHPGDRLEVVEYQPNPLESLEDFFSPASGAGRRFVFQ